MGIDGNHQIPRAAPATRHTRAPRVGLPGAQTGPRCVVPSLVGSDSEPDGGEGSKSVVGVTQYVLQHFVNLLSGAQG